MSVIILRIRYRYIYNSRYINTKKFYVKNVKYLRIKALLTEVVESGRHVRFRF